MSKRRASSREAALHRQFVRGAMAGQEGAGIRVSCNPPFDAPVSAEEKARRMSRMGDLSSDSSGVKANQGLTREERIRGLKDQATTNSSVFDAVERRKRLNKALLDDAVK